MGKKELKKAEKEMVNLKTRQIIEHLKVFGGNLKTALLNTEKNEANMNEVGKNLRSIREMTIGQTPTL